MWLLALHGAGKRARNPFQTCRAYQLARFCLLGPTTTLTLVPPPVAAAEGSDCKASIAAFTKALSDMQEVVKSALVNVSLEEADQVRSPDCNVWSCFTHARPN